MYKILWNDHVIRWTFHPARCFGLECFTVTRLQVQLSECGVKHGKNKSWHALLDYKNIQNHYRAYFKALLECLTEVKTIKYDNFTNQNVFLSI